MASPVVWWRAVRPFSFTVSVITPMVGAFLAVTDTPAPAFNWFRFALTLAGCVASHGAANLLSDYHDYRNRVDRPETLGSSRMLVEGRLTPGQVMKGSLALFAVAIAAAAYLVWVTPGRLFLLGLIALGGFLGVAYTARPVALKYRALGDMAVFIAFGPAMALGAYYVQAHRFSWTPVLHILPLALLVNAILHGNNLRDIPDDSKVSITTVATLLGERRAALTYYAILLAAYLLVPVLVVAAGMPATALATWLSLPLAARLAWLVHTRARRPREQIAGIDAETAKLHTVFGLLMLLSLMVHHFWLARQ